MGIQKETETELKTKILVSYTKYLEESLPDRRKVYSGQLEGWIFKWCKRYKFYERTEEMGIEIVEEVRKCADKNKTPEKFMEDLELSLKNAKRMSYRNKIGDNLREPRIIKVIKKIIATEEANEGRKLTNDERVNRICRLIPMREDTVREHLKGMDRIFVKYTHDYDEEDEVVESMEGHSLTTQEPISDPQDEALEDSEAEIIKDALETVLKESQEKMKPFYRALFTMRFLKKNKNYQRLMPALNGEILEMFKKDGKIPAQYEIYMKYHPEAEKSTAEANASQMSKKFFADLEKAIKEKSNPY